MLRATKTSAVKRTTFGRLCAMAVIGLVAIGLLSIRSPGPTANAQDAKPSTPPGAEYSLQYLDDDAGVVVGLRPQELLASEQGKAIYQMLGLGFDTQVKEVLGVAIGDIEQVVVSFDTRAAAVPTSVFVQLKNPPTLNLEKLGGSKLTVGNRTGVELPGLGILWQPNENSLAVNSRRLIERINSGRQTQPAFATTELWSQLKVQSAFAMIEGKAARSWIETMRQNPNDQVGQFVRSMAGTIADEATLIGLGASLREDMQLSMLTLCQDEKGAKAVHDTADASIVLLKNILKEQLRTQVAPPASGGGDTVQAAAAVAQLVQVGNKLLDVLESKVDGKLASLNTRLPMKEVALGPFVQAADASRKAAKRSQSMNNLKQIGLAFHMFHEVYSVFPGAAVHRNNSKEQPKKHPYSWRVAILPYIEQTELYNQYNFDEPWDSPSNQAVLKKMPAIYRHPDDPADSTNTSYVVMVGKETLFPPDTGLELRAITDGTSNTILAVEAKTSIPWTKPEDFSYAADQPLPKFGGYSENGFNALLGDGSVHFIAHSIDATTLRSMFTARGGEVIR